MAEFAIIRVSDVLNQALPPGTPPITDADIACECPTCGNKIQLSECSIEPGRETTYRCKCGVTFVIIGAPNPDGKSWPGRGYRLKDFVIRNAVALYYGLVVLPRSPNALARERLPSE
jgi:hypothetical protein